MVFFFCEDYFGEDFFYFFFFIWWGGGEGMLLGTNFKLVAAKVLPHFIFSSALTSGMGPQNLFQCFSFCQ
jgi:hypothetical protein